MSNTDQRAVEQHNHPATPHLQTKAVPRRSDWTPIKDDDVSVLALAFGHAAPKEDLMSNFGFNIAKSGRASSDVFVAGADIAKRRRIDLVEGVGPAPVRKGAAGAPAKKKSKTAPKKPKTITDLVTSHHQVRGKGNSPMAEFLVSTQVRARETVPEDNIEVATTSTKIKAAAGRPHGRKPTLLSPLSAMKAFEQQQAVFGTASQLVRDDALVEMELSSDPMSPQRTQPTSIGSVTPQTNRGSTRFMKTRNLWSAGDRDEDNALLHTDVVDLHSTPHVRAALAGKDALIETDWRSKGPPAAQSSSSLPNAIRAGMLGDVDVLSSPRIHSRLESVPGSYRPYSTSRAVQAIHASDAAESKEGVDAQETAAAQPQDKPSYAGMHITDLQKLVKNYGFKAIKSRQKMIDLLDKCWEEKEMRRLAKNRPPEATQSVAPKQSDFISNVHDLSNRLVPKTKTVKKPRAAARTKTPAKEPREPKKRKKASTEASASVESPKPKPQKRKPKAALSEERIVDVDDIQDDDFTTLNDLPEDKRKLRGAARPPTPPATLPAAHEDGPQTQNSKSHSLGHDVGHPPIVGPEIGEQIHSAILHQSEEAAADEERNHAQHPTWHEKMLMYDPIVIEDLARWLNAEGLDKVHEDREVTVIEVRDWCESKGICCMWKGGWRGQASKGGAE
ncbi:uncharacterized protein HMPREF1541_00981 [Cyphellophora europaea CBS 101466]|uniref:Structure-specific endonuclease subunit SLX4 n=1 Tax=Cyphellophora europaea (strain CBS 101466) TaxID=1220924 RepID=W2SDM0_CYPE1|nr:uncharacterized protein HMPREF1541_00981 [Cyphellophora europaea CBS 101466]ETN46792.1 hypothetical protein HMPREF1541_00981 [Cyphellophora europaea CBS 101466]